MDLQEAQKQLTAITTERDEALAKVKELEPLAEDGRAARTYMTAQCLEAFKVSRGESVTEKDIERFTKRAESMDFETLQSELEHLRMLAPAKPEVEPGSKTEQPDNSGSRDTKSEDKEVRGYNPPHWGV